LQSAFSDFVAQARHGHDAGRKCEACRLFERQRRVRLDVVGDDDGLARFVEIEQLAQAVALAAITLLLLRLGAFLRGLLRDGTGIASCHASGEASGAVGAQLLDEVMSLDVEGVAILRI